MEKEVEPELARLLDARDAGDHDLLLDALRAGDEWAPTAARLLAGLDERRAVPLLVEHLDAERGNLRVASIRALSALGPPLGARERLTAIALDDPLPSCREWAALALGRYGGPEVAQLLLVMLDDPHPAVRLGAARGLVAIGDPAFAEPIDLARPRFLRQPGRWLADRRIWRRLLRELAEAGAGAAAGPGDPPA